MITWNDAQRGARYEVIPRNTVKTAAGGYCREYTARATVSGKRIETNGTACRQLDGSWKLIN